MKSPGNPVVATALMLFIFGTPFAMAAPLGVPDIPGLESSPDAPKLSEKEQKRADAEARQREALWEQQQPLWRALIHKFKVLQERRSQALAGSQSTRNKHVVALRALMDQAKALDAEGGPLGIGNDLWHNTINTELRIFGAHDPEIHCWINNDDMRVEPKTLVDPQTRVTYRLRADGRHVVAISPKGKILWAHNVFEDFGLEPYRYSKPVIVVFKLSASSQEEFEAGRKRAETEAVTIREARQMGFEQREDYSRRFIEVVFNSSQFGSIDTVTGKFIFEGQD